MFASIFLVHPATQNASAQTRPFIINVGVQDEMKTRNLIRGFFFGTDVWTADALNPVGEGTVQTDPETQTVLPYTMVGTDVNRSEEHTSELQSRGHLVCRLLLEKK